MGKGVAGVLLAGALLAGGGCLGAQSTPGDKSDSVSGDGTGSPPGDKPGDPGVPDAEQPLVRRWPPARPGYVNPIVEENKRPGHSNWSRFNAKSKNGELDGYADRVSAKAGERVEVMVSASKDASATWTLYRLGWYGGAGARQIATGNIRVGPQAPCPPHPTTGLVRCSWTPTFSVTVPEEWVSGLYVFKLVREDQYGSYVPLVVTDERPADLLLQASVLTYQAYNDWGGTSLYSDGPLSLPWRKAVEVSFDRPYREDVGAGQMLRYDSKIARWLEKHGYDVAYTTNVDVALGGRALVRRHGAFLSVGHDEYWSKSIRDALEGARDEGVSLLFFSANSAYWQVRLADDAGKGPRRVIGWKESWGNDPDQGPEVTARFRDEPVDRPENGIMGVMLTNWGHLRFPLVPLDPKAWLYEGTGLAKGDAIPWMMGYETDSRVDNGFEPEGLEVLSRNAVLSVEGKVAVAESTAYRTKAGALVFAGGTIEWGNGLGALGEADPRVERMTANVIHEAIGVPVPESIVVRPPKTRIDGAFVKRVTTVATGLGAVTSVAVLPDGALAAADTGGNRIVRVGPAPERKVTVLAGTGREGRANASSATPGAQVEFNHPTTVVADDEGRILVADTRNHCIRAIAADAAHTVTTLAGRCGESGFQDGSASDARFAFPMGLALDPVTDELVVADSWNHRIRAIDPRTGRVRTIAGSVSGLRGGPASSALFRYPTDVAAAPDGRLYVTVAGEFVLAEIDNDAERTVSLIVTGARNADDGTGDSAGVGVHLGLAWANGRLLASDASVNRIRALAPHRDPARTVVTTVAGKGRYGRVDGDGDEASFAMPSGLAVGPDGTVYVADTGNGAIRALSR